MSRVKPLLTPEYCLACLEEKKQNISHGVKLTCVCRLIGLPIWLHGTCTSWVFHYDGWQLWRPVQLCICRQWSSMNQQQPDVSIIFWSCSICCSNHARDARCALCISLHFTAERDCKLYQSCMNLSSSQKFSPGCFLPPVPENRMIIFEKSAASPKNRVVLACCWGILCPAGALLAHICRVNNSTCARAKAAEAASSRLEEQYHLLQMLFDL